MAARSADRCSERERGCAGRAAAQRAVKLALAELAWRLRASPASGMTAVRPARWLSRGSVSKSGNYVQPCRQNPKRNGNLISELVQAFLCVPGLLLEIVEKITLLFVCVFLKKRVRQARMEKSKGEVRATTGRAFGAVLASWCGMAAAVRGVHDSDEEDLKRA